MTSNAFCDREQTAADIQQLANTDAVAAFFTTLGYDTSARLPQTPAAMSLRNTTQTRQRPT